MFLSWGTLRSLILSSHVGWQLAANTATASNFNTVATGILKNLFWSRITVFLLVAGLK